MSTTVAEAVDGARTAMRALQSLGEEIADEWQYVTDLEAGWGQRLDEVVSVRGDQAIPADASAAIDVAIAETALIADPHRAIDWLSTFPQVVLFALDEAG